LLYHYVILILAAIALWWLVAEEQRPKFRLICLSPLIALANYGLLDDKPAFLAAGLIASLGFLIAFYSVSLYKVSEYAASISLLILLATGIILRDGYSFPNYPRFGATSMEKAIVFVGESLPRGSRLYTQVPLEGVAARMLPIVRGDIEDDLNSGVPLCQVIVDHQIAGFYVTPSMIRDEGDLWRMIQQAEGSCLESPVIFDPGSIQVILTKD
jgi:hypothetical protein